jgi:hypothetical protein
MSKGKKKQNREHSWEYHPEQYLYHRLQAGPSIDGKPGEIGDLVFWHGTEPFWICEWQPDNGDVYAIVDAKGVIGLADAAELTRDFRRRVDDDDDE